MKELVDHLRSFLDQTVNLKFDKERLTLVFKKSENEATLATLDLARVKLEETGVDEREIDLEQFAFYFYFDEQDFIRRTHRGKWDKPTYIYKSDAVYDPLNRITEINGKESEYFLIKNNQTYFELLELLKRNEHKEDSIFYFVDYFSWDNEIIVFTTLKKEGKVTFKFKSTGLNLPHDINLQKNFSRLLESFDESNKHLPKFIKNELTSQLSKYDAHIRVQKFLETLGEIINVAEQNFEIYLHDLSLESLKKDFIEHKNKYFNQLREILSKLTNQIIGLPITIAASAFGTYKVSDSPTTLVLILFVFCLYACYSVVLLKLQKDDVKDIKEMFERDFDYIKNSQFFVKFPQQLADFELVRQKIEKRIKHLLLAINVYYALFVCSVFAFVAYLLMQLAFQFIAIVFVMALVLLVGLLTFYFFVR